jgi:purine-nucleoside phosphorylase
VKNCILTNSAGAVNPDFQPGDLMVITDQINLLGENPLSGPNQDSWGKRFPDMSHAYNPALVEAIQDVAASIGIDLKAGIYTAVKGPSFETPAEVKMLAKLGTDVVGMSTVPETIALRHLGVRVGAISYIANMAAGLSTGILSHEKMIQSANESSISLTCLIKGLLARFREEGQGGKTRC